MPSFSNVDPDSFYDNGTAIEVLLHHEAAHLCLAYYYGFEIGGFAFKKINGELSGGVRNRPTAEHYTRLGSRVAASNEARKLLAGEVAARHLTKESNDVISITLPDDEVAKLSRRTRFSEVHTTEPSHDVSRVLALFGQHYFSNRSSDGILKEVARAFGFISIEENWWDWFWQTHNETVHLVKEVWRPIQTLANSLRKQQGAIDTVSFEIGEPTAIVDGNVLIAWCQGANAPELYPRIRSTHYRPDW